jgi:hypothetical protein
MAEKRNAMGCWWESQRQKRLLGRPKCRWVDNIRMDLGEVACSDVDWIGSGQVESSC